MQIETERQGGVVTVILNRPEKANAYTDAMIDALAGALEGLGEDDRVLILTGAGDRHFCAGADLDEVERRPQHDVLNLKSQRVFTALARLGKPTIAAINGPALGGGLELTLACDLRIAASHAVFGLPETELGLIPAAGGTFRLPRVVGLARAKELILLGRRIDAREAHAIGLVNAVVPIEDLLDAARHWAFELARKDPMALRLAKSALDLAAERDDATLQVETTSQALLYARRNHA